MEKLKAKHDHKLTDILKVFIFAIFLMLPFMVYCPNALYYGTNKYAVAQEKKEQVPVYYESNEVNSIDDLIVGNIYHFEGSNFNFTTQEFVYVIDYALSGIYTNANATAYLTTPYINFNSTTINIIYKEENNTRRATYTNTAKFDFVYNGQYTNSSTFVNYVTESDYKLIKDYTEETNTMSIAESMNTAWQQTWETTMFNWTNESVLKQGLDNFTGVFGVTDTSYFTNLIVYELIMVAIYIVIDIVLTMFKWLTHLIGEK